MSKGDRTTAGRSEATQRRWPAALLLLLVLAGVLSAVVLVTASARQQGEKAVQMPGAREAHYTAGGTDTCLTCHGGEKMLLMAQTPHGNASNPHTPYAQHGCESCHGPGSVHASRAGGGRGFPELVSFDDEESAQVKLDACLSCHAQDMGELEGMAFRGTVHDFMGCVDCHDAHSMETTLGERDAQVEACGACHARQLETHPRFEGQGNLFDKLACSGCHDVHRIAREP